MTKEIKKFSTDKIEKALSKSFKQLTDDAALKALETINDRLTNDKALSALSEDKYTKLVASANVIQKAMQPYSDKLRVLESERFWKQIQDSVPRYDIDPIVFERMGNTMKYFSEVSLIPLMKECKLASRDFIDSLGCISEWSHAIENNSGIASALGMFSEYITRNDFYDEEGNATDFLDIVNGIYDEEYDDEVADEGFESAEELGTALGEETKKPGGLVEWYCSLSEKRKRQIHIVLNVIITIMTIYWVIEIQPKLEEQVFKLICPAGKAFLKSLPDKTGEVIEKLVDGIRVIIVGDIPYYYYVKVVENNGNERSGYVSKKSIKFEKE